MNKQYVEGEHKQKNVYLKTRKKGHEHYGFILQ